MRTFITTSLFVALLIGAGAHAQSRNVVFNGVRISDQDVYALEGYYQVRIPDSGYWYDPVSGLWGIEGGPTIGQILPGLPLGGPLRADASGGGTGVFFNGREIHVTEYAFLYRLFGVVYPGRYWLDSQGYVGFEGGPALGNLAAAMGGGSGGGGGSGLGHSTTGSVIGGDGIVGYVSPFGGTSVTCVPGEGCTY